MYKAVITVPGALKVLNKCWLLLFYFFFLAALGHMEFLGQGLDPLTHCAGPMIEPLSWCWRDTASPIVAQREL